MRVQKCVASFAYITLFMLINALSIYGQSDQGQAAQAATEARYEESRDHFTHGEYAEAIQAAEAAVQALKKEPVADTTRYVKWAHLLGRSQQRLGSHPAAISVLEPAYKVSRAASLARLLSESFMQQARYEKARSLYRELHRADSTDRNVRIQLARLAMQGRDWFEAAHHFEALLRADSTNGEWHAHLARCHEAMSKPESALEHLRSAHRLRPQDASIALQLSSRLRSLGALQDAVDVIDRTLDETPADARLWRRRADLSFAQSSLHTAETAYQQTLAYGDSSATVYRRLGIVQAGQARHADALENLNAALQRDSTSARTRLYLGISYRHLDSLDQSARVLREAIAVVADGPITNVYMELAQTENARDRLPASLDAYRMAKRLQPDRSEILFRLAQLYDENYLDKSTAARYYRHFLSATTLPPTDTLVVYAQDRLDALVPILHMQSGRKADSSGR
ncbi:hypothetical protein CRI94_09875 [Longibacter salinarum]|uniref:Uncharacterized protein n=1 Tax=Longibacter salinarum TaxID=1850348 RepID=A0A2A8CY78_9BACT|nr:tetratricopeptide repeat protein [Longibacter salinarum]PEN13606.1 hypothetical protein CRI94_09875 [Longibacter salinarum]